MTQGPAKRPISVDDNGDSLTVDGTVAVSNLAAVQPVSDNGGSLTVDGTVLIDSTTPVDVAGTVTVTPNGTAQIRSHRANLLGVGTWAVGVDTAFVVKSVSIRRRVGGAAAGVTISDHAGVVTTLLVGETETWSVTALEFEIEMPLSVTGVALSDVVITWTETAN